MISATLFALASIPGHLIGGWIADKWGRKHTMLIFNLSSYAFWLASALARNRFLLYTTYSLQGLFGSITFNLISKFTFLTFSKLPVIR